MIVDPAQGIYHKVKGGRGTLLTYCNQWTNSLYMGQTVQRWWAKKLPPLDSSRHATPVFRRILLLLSPRETDADSFFFLFFCRLPRAQ